MQKQTDGQAIGRRLAGLGSIVPTKVQISRRAFLRLCDAGKAPWGIKLGSRRLWDLSEIDEWIASGCCAVRRSRSEGQ